MQSRRLSSVRLFVHLSVTRVNQWTATEETCASWDATARWTSF